MPTRSVAELLVRYVFLDIVGYTHNRSVEAQVHIIEALNKIVRHKVDTFQISEDKRIFLPTGDGMCICILGDYGYDIHLQLAGQILSQAVFQSDTNDVEMHKFSLRIGVNQNFDVPVIDINRQPNLAGSGINIAQRIMGVAEPDTIRVGQSVYDVLQHREKYMGRFTKCEDQIKHGQTLITYKYKYDPIVEYSTSALLEKMVSLADQKRAIPKRPAIPDVPRRNEPPKK